jgi:uncharacterized protein (DUF4213/DUF364 family)
MIPVNSRSAGEPRGASVAQELLECIDAAQARGIQPRVRTLHRPAGPPDSRSRDAEFCALELDDGSVGFSFALLGDTLAGLGDPALARRLAGSDAAAIARGYAGAGEVPRALGLASINAITRSVYRRAGYRPDTATDSIGLIDPHPEDHVGMVGLFRPLLERILATGARLTVVELRPELAQDSGRLRVTLDPAELAACNKVICTSSVLLNDSLETVLAACPAPRYFGIVGPSAGCSPDPLFARGVDTLGGLDVVDLAAFRTAFASGESWGRFCRKTCIRRAAYPGFAALLAQVR